VHRRLSGRRDRKTLSPKKIIVDIRRRLMEKAPVMANTGLHPRTGRLFWRKKLVDDYITEDELWACTTCMACVQECPVQIEHVDAIVDMRRYLVLNESRFPKNFRQRSRISSANFTPWGFQPFNAFGLTEGLKIPRISDNKECELLFWVGCAGAYDARYRKVTRAFARLMEIGGVSYAILAGGKMQRRSSPAGGK